MRVGRAADGSVAVATVAVALVAAIVVSIVVAVVGGVLHSRLVAIGAADEAALAAARRAHPEAVLGGSPTVAAERAARAAGATLVACDCARGTVTVGVTVEVEVPLGPARDLGFTRARASASATLTAPP